MENILSFQKLNPRPLVVATSTSKLYRKGYDKEQFADSHRGLYEYSIMSIMCISTVYIFTDILYVYTSTVLYFITVLLSMLEITCTSTYLLNKLKLK